MARDALRARRGLRPKRSRRALLEVLEGRSLLSAGPNEITALYQNGFTPTDLHLNGSATLAGTALQLTDGGSSENGSAFDTTPVDVTKSFTTTFQFRLTPDGSGPFGEGFTFDIQNTSGITDLGTTNVDMLGLSQGPHVAIKFGTENDNPNRWSGLEYSDNSTELYVGNGVPSFADGTEIDVPKSLVDFHSQHLIQVTVQYTAPAGQASGQLSETITDTVTSLSWNHVYTNVNMQSVFKLTDVTGQYAYAGFTGSTGSPSNNGAGYVFGQGRSTQDILNWTWHDGSESGPAPYSASFALANPVTTAGAVYDAHGKLVRTLWQAEPLPAGTFTASWDGLDQFGNALNATTNPGPYSFSIVENTETYTRQVVANNTNNPADGYASISSIEMNGVAVSPDGSSIWTSGVDADTAGGGSVKQFDASGNVVEPATSLLANSDMGGAVASDGTSLYLLAEINNWSGEFGVVKINLSNYDQTTGFTDQNHTNADGSQVVTAGGVDYLSILKNSKTYWSLRGIAVSGGSLWVTDPINNLVRQYDKVTGDQVGTPIAVKDPTGIAVDASGNVWVAHGTSDSGPANVLSVYNAQGALIRDVTEATGLGDVWSMTIASGKLYVADNGAGHVVVYTLSGDTITNGSSPQLVGRPATFGTDDGVNAFWDLRGVSVDAQGNIYTVQNTLSPGAAGSQLEKWSASGTSLWVKGGYEYQSIAGAYSPDDPTTLYSSSLHRYTLDPATGGWQYTGSVAYPGWNSNQWSGLTSEAPPAPPTFVKIGSTDFFTLSTGDRMIFYKINPDGSLHPSTILGISGLSSGDNWTWTDSLGDGVPQAGQIRDSGVNPGTIWQLRVDDQGNLWYQIKVGPGQSTVYEVPLQGLDAHGNPSYDWKTAVARFTGPTPTSNLVVADDGVYVQYTNTSLAPQSSASAYAGYSVGGANAVAKYSLSGQLLWTVALPEYSQSIAAIPGGGVIVGSMIGSRIYQITPAGQVLDAISPLTTGDWLDFAGGSIDVDRNPVDGKIDVFTEGIGFSDNEWYRIDDHTPAIVLSGTVTAGVTTTLGVTLPTPAAPSLLLADDSGVKGDNITNVTQPHLTGTADPSTTIWLLSAKGLPIASATVGSNGVYSVQVPSPLSQGTFTFSVREQVSGGELSGTSATYTFTILTTPPAPPTAPTLLASDDSGSVGDGITNVNRPHLTGTAAAFATIELLNASNSVIGIGAASSAGNYSIQPTSALADGVYILHAVAIDVAGNVSTANGSFTLTIDTTAPNAPSTPALSPADDTGTVGDGITRVTQPHLIGTAEANATVQLLNAIGTVIGTSTANSSGAYSVTPATPLGDGTYTLQVRDIDLAGNVGPASGSFTLTIDTTPPAAPSAPKLLSSDDSGIVGDGITKINQPHLTGTAAANTTIDLLNASNATIGTGTASSTGNYSIQPTSALSDGVYVVHAVAIDSAGNVSPASGTFTLTIDTTPPAAPSTPTLLAADDTGTIGDGITTVPVPHLIGMAEANATLNLLNGSGTVIGTTRVSNSGAYSIVPSSPLAVGAYTLSVRAVDAAGNVGPASGTFSLTILPAPSAPSAPVLLSADDSGVKGDGITNVAQPHFTGTGAPGTTVQLITTAGLVLGSEAVSSNGSFSVQPASPLADGTYAIEARTLDAGGGLSGPSAAISLTILTSAPAAPSKPALLASDDSGAIGDGITNVNRPHLIGTATAGLTVQIVDAFGNLIGSAIANSAGAFSIQPTTAFANGTVHLQARAIDVAGNVSAQSAAFSLTIITTPPATPAAPKLSPADDTGLVPNRTTVRSPQFVGTAIPGDFVDLIASSGAVLASTTAAAGSGSYVLQPTTSFNPGVVSLSVRVRDLAGNVSQNSPALSVTIAEAPAADFDGDGKTDLVTFKPSTAQWVDTYSSGSGALTATFGMTNLGDVPVPGDYDGIGKSELAVYRPSTGQWFISGPNGTRIVSFGAPNTDIAVPGDYDNVGHTEIAVFRPSTAQWFVLGPNGGHVLGVFGATSLSDVPVPGDYDGIGHTEPAVYRPSTAQWFVLGPNGGRVLGTFGAPNLSDIPVPGDYDGVGRTEMAVFRPSTTQWFVMGPTGGHVVGTVGATNLSVIPAGGPGASLDRLGVLHVIHAMSIAPSVPSPSAVESNAQLSSSPSSSPVVSATPAVTASITIKTVTTKTTPSRTPPRPASVWSWRRPVKTHRVAQRLGTHHSG